MSEQTSSTDSSDAPLLEVRDVSKSFPGVQALKDVNLSIGAGEVLSVIGENGAGKSTLMKILAGVQEPDGGKILIDGKLVRIDSTRTAMDLGVVLIHQELNLSDNLDVGSNIFLGREPLKNRFIDTRRIHQESVEYLRKVGLDIDSRTIVSTLTIGKQQLIEIAKALSVNARLLIMDEPTSSLSAGESEALFKVVEDLRQKGVSIIYISHRLGEVIRLSDRVTVLRDGENAGDLAKEEISHDNMVKLMVGRDVSKFYARKQHDVGDVLLEVKELVTPVWPKHQLDFQVRAGEIVGVAGLVGAGRTEMLRSVFGVDKPLRGEIRIGGKRTKIKEPSDAIEAGMALVPEDRKQHGLVLGMTVRRNVGLAGLFRNRLGGGFLNERREKADSADMIEKMRIRTPHDRQVVQFLSGGNQQKVVIGKWMSMQPRLLLLDEPTRGIDVGAKEEIYRLMESLAAEGMGILFVSSEMEEIIGMSDRVLVMHEGRITGELSRDELNEESIMQLATGGQSVVS